MARGRLESFCKAQDAGLGPVLPMLSSDMPITTSLILSNGGLRSLVAIACAAEACKGRRLVVAHLSEGRNQTQRRAVMARRQAEHYRIRDFVELILPRARGGREERQEGHVSPGRAALLLAAVSRASALGADELIWPAQASAEGLSAVKLSELAMTVEHLAVIEAGEACPIRTPVIDLTDGQLLELAIHLQVPTELSWSCQSGASQPCRACNGCRRRLEAFEQIGLADPLQMVRRASA